MKGNVQMNIDRQSLELGYVLGRAASIMSIAGITADHGDESMRRSFEALKDAAETARNNPSEDNLRKVLDASTAITDIRSVDPDYEIDTATTLVHVEGVVGEALGIKQPELGVDTDTSEGMGVRR